MADSIVVITIVITNQPESQIEIFSGAFHGIDGIVIEDLQIRR